MGCLTSLTCSSVLVNVSRNFSKCQNNGKFVLQKAKRHENNAKPVQKHKLLARFLHNRFLAFEWQHLPEMFPKACIKCQDKLLMVDEKLDKTLKSKYQEITIRSCYSRYLRIVGFINKNLVGSNRLLVSNLYSHRVIQPRLD